MSYVFWRVSPLRLEKKVLVVCLAGMRTLLRPKKKVLVVCLASCAVVSVFGSGGKQAVFLLWRESFITTEKKFYCSRLSGGLCCCVSFWFWREIGFGCTYYYVLGVPYSCGVVLVILVLAGNSFWCYVRTQCTIQIVITTGKKKFQSEKKKFQSSVWQVRDRYYDRKKKFQSSVWRVRNRYYDRKKKFQS